MAAAANFGRANRQLLSVAARRAFALTVGTGELVLLYDVSHNLAKLEHHEVEGRRRELCVHRKALPGRYHLAIRTCRRTWPMWGNLCWCRVRWAPPRMYWSANGMLARFTRLAMGRAGR